MGGRAGRVEFLGSGESAQRSVAETLLSEMLEDGERRLPDRLPLRNTLKAGALRENAGILYVLKTI